MDSGADWTLRPDAERVCRRWKWGWNAETGEATIWDVGGPGDGFPSHESYLTTAWGRRPQVGRGDVVGFAEWIPPALHVQGYGGNAVPEAVLRCFRDLKIGSAATKY